MCLKLTNLSKSFEGRTILQNFSFDFSDRGIYVVSGESGIGKTTLLRIIAGLDKDYSGQVLGGGIRRVSMCFQEYRLFPQLSALDNVIFAISDRKYEAVTEKATKMLKRLGLYESDILLSPDQLSGGMKQRVSLARAFLKDSPILLLDEATKELDADNANTVREIIIEESMRRLVILATHNQADLSMPNLHLINL